MHLKLIFRRSDGLVLGAQAVGERGVERRIDVISFAMQKGSTVFDLEEAELCYAPQFGMAKDPVNLAGMVSANVLRGDVSLAKWSELPNCGAFLLDVREEEEFKRGWAVSQVYNDRLEFVVAEFSCGRSSIRADFYLHSHLLRIVSQSFDGLNIVADKQSPSGYRLNRHENYFL
jgi:rhodanese-related sulfurtransferase